MTATDPRHTRFVHNYFYGKGTVGNASQSALKAGFAISTAKKKASSWVGSKRENSSSKPIWDLVLAEREKLEEAQGITEKRILKEYERLAFYDPRRFFDEEGNLKDVSKLDDDTVMALAGMDIATRFTKDGEAEVTKKIKLVDKKATLDSLSKIKGMFAPEKMEHSVDKEIKEILSMIDGKTRGVLPIDME